MIGHLMLFCSLAGLAACTVFLFLVIVAALRFRVLPPDIVASERNDLLLPPVTILKPLCGMEPLLEQNLESFFRQDYPHFEIIFGARDISDPALEVVNALRRHYPRIRVQIVLSGEPAWPNAKVYALHKMVAVASHSYLVIADSDVRVSADYLQQVVRPLVDPAVGLVTCLYRGMPTGGLWSRLEALGMSVEMSSGVLVADMLEGMKFALGPTMATRKDVLEKLGGIGVLGFYCADDYVLGGLTHAAGKRVVLSRHVIDHLVLSRSAQGSLLHQVRWMKSTRFSRPVGHVASGVTFAMPFGLLGMAAGLAVGNGTLGLGLLGCAILNRIVLSLVVGWSVVRDRGSLRFCWLYPLRDLMGFFFWCASFVGTGIMWRGERYRLTVGGKMVREADSLPAKRSLAQRARSPRVSVNNLP